MSRTPPWISIIVIARDEEHTIEACLKSVHWADEILEPKPFRIDLRLLWDA